MEVNTPAGQDLAATQAKVMVNIPFIKSLKEEISILQGCTQTEGTDISNMFEMLDEQLSALFEKAEKLPENEKDEMLKPLYNMDTLIRTIRSKINNKLFWAIDNVVYELEKEKAA